MKSFFIFIIAVLCLVGVLVSQDSNSLEGTWEHTISTWTAPHSSGTSQPAPLKRKIYSKSYYVLVIQDVSKGVGAFLHGIYEIDGDTYIEHVKASSDTSYIGIDWKATIKRMDNTLTLKYTAQDTVEIVEEWKRID